MKIMDPKAGPTIDHNVFDRRFKETVQLIDIYGVGGLVLVFGERSNFELEISKRVGEKFTYTNFDLNYEFKLRDDYKYDTLFCCEVIEHLLNPLWFFLQARAMMGPKSLMYLTYPIQPHPFWCGCHFHEYDKSRFRFLLREAGLVIVDYREYVQWKRITGIRPIIRNTPMGWLKQQIYVLKKGPRRCDMV